MGIGSNRPTRRLLRPFRVAAWWEHKLIPLAAVYYCVVVAHHASIAPHAARLGQLLVAVVAGAASVSVLNDITDREEDALAGKTNAIAEASMWLKVAALATPTAVGVAMFAVWRHDPPVIAIYAASWLMFLLYSLPPVRLKRRGVVGVAADAFGASLFPALLAAVLASRALRVPVDMWFIIGVILWSGGYGGRGILLHQLADRENDLRSGVPTFAVRHRPEMIAKLSRRVVFPLELAGLLILLIRVASLAPLLALTVYLLLTWLRWHRWGRPVSLVRGDSDSRMTLQEYYNVFLPMALLTASAWHRLGLVVVALHVVVFPLAVATTTGETFLLLTRACRKLPLIRT